MMNQPVTALGVGDVLAADDPAVPEPLRDALARGPVVLYFLRAFT